MTAAATVPADLEIGTISGDSFPLREWVTTFHLVVVVIDPYTDESSWLLDTASRVLSVFRGADCRVAWLVTAGADDAKTFLGPYAKDLLTLLDPDKALVKALGLERLPALVHIRQDCSVAGAAEGWKPSEWQTVTDQLGDVMSWSKPRLPAVGDPSPFVGSPAT